MGALPTEDVLGTLYDDTLVAHVGSHATNLVAIDKVGVAHHLGLYTEEFLYAASQTGNLVLEALLATQRSQTMAIGLCQEVCLASLCNLLQEVDNLGSILLEHLDGYTRERETALEVIVLLAHLQQCGQCGNVAVVGCIADGALVLIVIVVVVVLADFKETIALQMNRLMYLEI